MAQDGLLKLTAQATGPKGAPAWRRDFDLDAANFTEAFLTASAQLGGDLAWESLRIKFAQAPKP